MTKQEAIRYGYWLNSMQAIGINIDDAVALRRCEMALRRWAERECGDGSNWAIERDESGVPWNVYHGHGKSSRYRIADREKGALKRASAIAGKLGLEIYHQGDPRGIMLYLYRPEDKDRIECNYNRVGIPCNY